MRAYIQAHKRILAYIIFFVLSLSFVALIILPATYFDTGRATCLSVILFDRECYGCGMTRGIQHLIHLDFEKAYQFNKLSFIVLPLSIIAILMELNKMRKS